MALALGVALLEVASLPVPLRLLVLARGWHPITPTFTSGFSFAPFCPPIAVNIVSDFFVHNPELAARIDSGPSGSTRSNRRIGTSGIALNATDVKFL